MKSLKHKEDKEEQSEQQDTEHDHTDEYEVRSEEEIPAIEKIINDKKAKKKKTLMVATAAIVCIAVAAAYLLMPKKPDKLPINLGAMPIKEAQEARNPGSTKQQPQAPTQADILANPAPPDPATPAAALQEDTRNGYEKTAQWWKDYVDKALQIQQVLDKRYKEMEAENPTGKKEVPKLFSKEIARIYPGSVYNGQEGYLQMTPQQQIYFDSTMSVTKIVMNDQYQRIYTFRSPTGAKQNDFQIIRDKESITVDLDANIPNNCQ